MGVMDKFKDLVGIEEIDDDVTEDDIEEAGQALERRQVEPRSRYPRTQRDKVVPMAGSRATNPFKLVVIDPEGFEECPKLVDSLKARKPIIINLEKTDSDTAKKIFDFLSGATYALNGNVQKVANNIFVFAPDNVDISSSTDSNRGFEFSAAPSSSDDSWR
ncbi:MAG: cell division protein SepF [Eubacteriaceae bacterium]|jgi:cell division inhibitor SepF|nr:cell division protein SepF [Eubacteriaceae bacterium]